jgi:hypothetical protein
MKQTFVNPFEVFDARLTEIQSLLVEIRHKKEEPQPTDKSDTYIDQKRVAELLDVSGVSVWEYERKGLLKSYRIGNLKRFLLSEVMASPKLIERTAKK